jgi:hypothetical protein
MSRSSFCFLCGNPIKFDNEYINERTGKKIPLDAETNEPHNCPVRSTLYSRLILSFLSLAFSAYARFLFAPSFFCRTFTHFAFPSSFYITSFENIIIIFS